MKNLRFLKPIISYFGIGLIITTLSRILLFLIFKERVVENENYSQLFSIGLRFDIILLSYTAIIPTLLILLLPDSLQQKIKKFLNVYFLFFLFLFFLLELATLDFIKQYDTRPNRLFLDYLIYPKEVLGTLLKSYLPSLKTLTQAGGKIKPGLNLEFSEWALKNDKRFPFLIHWAGDVRTQFVSKMTNSDLLLFFEKHYYSKIPFGLFLFRKRKIFPIIIWYLKHIKNSIKILFISKSRYKN
jgi:hypothetical protein